MLRIFAFNTKIPSLHAADLKIQHTSRHIFENPSKKQAFERANVGATDCDFSHKKLCNELRSCCGAVNFADI